MILTHPGLTKLTFMDYLLTMLRNLLRRKHGCDTAICPIALVRATPTPFAINATCPRYFAVRSEIEHCEPLPLRVPVARSRPHPRPSAIRLVIKRFCLSWTWQRGWKPQPRRHAALMWEWILSNAS